MKCFLSLSLYVKHKLFWSCIYEQLYTSYVNISFPEILQLSLLLELQHLKNGLIIFFTSYL